MKVELWFKSMANVLTIAELGSLTHKPSSALRYYERQELLSPIGRSGGMRVYADSAVIQIALIDFLQISGFTINEIRTLVSPDGTIATDWREKTNAKIAEIAGKIEEFERAQVILEHTARCPHDALDECPVFLEGIESHAQQMQSRQGSNPVFGDS